MANHFTHLNRPINPVCQLAFPKQQSGSLSQRVSFDFDYAHPFSSQQYPLEDRSIRHPGANFSTLNLNLLSSRAFGDHLDLCHPGSQNVEGPRSSTKPSGPSEPAGSSQTDLSDVAAISQTAPEYDSKSCSCPPYFNANFNECILNFNHSGSCSADGSPPQSDGRPPTFTSLKSRDPHAADLGHQNQSETSQKNLRPEDRKNACPFDALPTGGTEEIAASCSHANLPGVSSSGQRSDKRKVKLWKRKITERRREQNKIHQRAFRKRREVMLKQKDVAMGHLKECLIRCQEAVGRQSETIEYLQERLGLV
ncbi:hypothetical protein PCANC_25020 [Puccinia coronata f. sp. avenae]|uniref:BZIP domain-containing protein n=1 Tax=Puccinia coronata f. sp. avenae TaxID=200324 RepID=A0A2N5U733_9BASI|nr:hypothetical protein PCANC_25020 [Puccinia coronata f. sp. avenae]PLW33564.1 hypothetical protein PCASD_14088 [Puccinia coronata f. sp. avenae]